MNIFSDPNYLPRVVTRYGSMWALESKMAKFWTPLTFDVVLDVVTRSRISLPLIFPDALVLEEFLAGTDPELQIFRDYVRLVRQSRHQFLAVTVEELIELLKPRHPDMVCEPGRGVEWAKRVLDSDLGRSDRYTHSSLLYSEDACALWPFADFVGCEFSRFALAAGLKHEEELVDVCSGLVEGGTPVRLKRSGSQEKALIISRSVVTGIDDPGLLVSTPDGLMLIPVLISGRAITFWLPEDYRRAEPYFDADLRLIHLADPVRPWLSGSVGNLLTDRVAPLDVMMAGKTSSIVPLVKQ